MPKKDISASSESQLFREIFDNISSGVSIYDSPDDGKSFTFKDINQAALKMDGLIRKDVIGKSLEEVFPGVDAFGLLDIIKEVWKTGKPQLHPISIYSDNRISTWKENYICKLDSGEVVAIYRDLTSEKELTDNLRQQASLLQGVLDNIPDIVGIQKPDHTIIAYNRAGYEFLGVTKETINDRKCYEMIGRTTMCNDCATVDAVKYKKPNTIEKLMPDGKTWFECRSMPILDSDGNVELVVEMLRNITERKNFENALKESKERAELFYNLVPSAIFSTNQERVITSWNKRAEEITGYTEEEVLGKECTLFAMHPCTEGCGLFGGSNNVFPLMHKECTIKTKDGRHRIVSKNADLLKDSEGNVIGGIESFNDITEQKKLDQLREDFIAITTHELRTPLTVLKNALDLLKDSVEHSLDSNDAKWLGIAMDHTDRMTKMTNDLLDVSRYEAGKMDLSVERILISDLMRNIGNSLTPQFEQRNLELKIEIPKEDIVIEADREKMEQVFMNLIGNSLKFTNQGHVLLGLQENDDHVVIMVQDTGEGIPKEDLTTIFDKFMQVTKARRTRQKGTGLGLSIVKNIVELHKGKIVATSFHGIGTTFTITLPKKQD